MAAASPTIEAEIRDLLQTTREEAEQYSSAHYRDANGPRTGLAMRLEAIEEGLIRVARALDER